jgi:hypothetical protein
MRVIALVTAGQRVGIVDEDKLIDVALGLGRAPGSHDHQVDLPSDEALDTLAEARIPLCTCFGLSD